MKKLLVLLIIVLILAIPAYCKYDVNYPSEQQISKFFPEGTPYDKAKQTFCWMLQTWEFGNADFGYWDGKDSSIYGFRTYMTLQNDRWLELMILFREKDQRVFKYEYYIRSFRDDPYGRDDKK